MRVAVAIRITLVSPPPGVSFCIQGRDDELLDPRTASGGDLSFDVGVSAQRVGGAPRFFGDVTQGPPTGRFVYVCSGTLAGQAASCWTRRAKVPLGGIPWRAILGSRLLEARIEGTAKDGGPACGTVKLLGGGWTPSG